MKIEKEKNPWLRENEIDYKKFEINDDNIGIILITLFIVFYLVIWLMLILKFGLDGFYTYILFSFLVYQLQCRCNK